MTAPLVSVILAAYNAETFLPAALESVLSQSFRDFEVLLIDDGSTDATPTIADSFASRDNRIRVIHQKNQGLAMSLNRGLELARGEFIARMDADDECLPERFERQVQFLRAHPDVGICGTWMKVIGSKKGGIWKHPSDDASIKSRLMFRTALCHPTVMARRNLFDQHGLRYDPSHRHTEDYDLWSRLIPLTNFANLEEILYLYRRYSGQVTQRADHNAIEIADGRRIHKRVLRHMGYEPSELQLDWHSMVVFRKFPAKLESLTQMEGWLRDLAANNQRTQLYPQPIFSRTLSEMWWPACKASSRIGLPAFRLFSQSPLSVGMNLSMRKRISYMFKCMLKLK